LAYRIKQATTETLLTPPKTTWNFQALLARAGNCTLTTLPKSRKKNLWQRFRSRWN